ncbi:peptidoglycan recognition family protein [Paenibacillus sp. HJGM_3]|uniref:peptidoglycan recognition protein family protein n=1 Tax=Paenibacillus sp. HJGM_3 TaxID=3379816 RepID=UPI00385B1BD6
MSLRNISLVAGLPFNVPPIEDITDQLPRHKKYTWETYPKERIIRGVNKGGYFAPGFRPLEGEEVDTIIVHHSGPPAGGTIQGHANYHVNTHGWAGIGYHIVIDNGRIFQTNDLMSMTFHCGGHNTYTVGICVNADLSQREITSRERELLYAAILTVKSLLSIKDILGHNQLNDTLCPATSMEQIRGDIAKLELQMKAAVDPAKVAHKCYVATEQHRWLYSQYAADPKGQKYLEPHLLELYEMMKERGLFFGSE